MNYLFAADLHNRTTTPRYRTETPFFDIVCLPKIQWLIDTALQLKAVLIIAGDIFHTTKISIEALNQIIHEFSRLNKQIGIVIGQHDLEYHSTDLTPSPIQTLLYSNVITVLQGLQKFSCIGASWEEEIHPKSKAKILVTHRTITKDTPPFFLKDAVSAEEILNMYPNIQYICSGDNHSPFVYKQGNRAVINCGAMIRSNKDQYNHTPRAYHLDTKTNKITPVFFPITKSEKAFNNRLIDLEQTTDPASIDISVLATELRKTTDTPDFVDTLNFVMKKAKATSNIVELAHTILKEST
jgi:DNA repair exonuclease SbcCD nuclease subunit